MSCQRFWGLVTPLLPRYNGLQTHGSTQGARENLASSSSGIHGFSIQLVGDFSSETYKRGGIGHEEEVQTALSS